MFGATTVGNGPFIGAATQNRADGTSFRKIGEGAAARDREAQQRDVSARGWFHEAKAEVAGAFRSLVNEDDGREFGIPEDDGSDAVRIDIVRYLRLAAID